MANTSCIKNDLEIQKLLIIVSILFCSKTSVFLHKHRPEKRKDQRGKVQNKIKKTIKKIKVINRVKTQKLKYLISVNIPYLKNLICLSFKADLITCAKYIKLTQSDYLKVKMKKMKQIFRFWALQIYN